ncbi:MAG: cysteine desulfurase [Ruminococcaceae bacterium]|nr:cysteine desulfurase [Oscillospiraceae bacterium]
MSEIKSIYLDNSATTKISDEALNKYNEVSKSCFGNPSSLHSFGLIAEKELNSAREAILASIGERESEVIFTASGSEANNLAIIGRALAKERYKRGAKIITTLGEHASVSAPIEKLREMGFKTAAIPTINGKIDTDVLLSELTPDTVLVSFMMVNNETGALYDISTASKLIKSRCPEALLHVDATQSYMKIKFTKRSLGADLITLSSHKIHGPKGVGALIVDKKVIKARGLSPLILGGGQERGLRSGTENVPAIAAFGEAVRVGMKNIDADIKKMHELREYLIEKIKSAPALSDIAMTLPESHAPHILNITLLGIKSETLLHYLSSLGIFVSSGSACSSNSTHVSSALTAYGKSESEADSSIRISFSKDNEKEDVDALCDGLASAISRLARKR